MLLDAVPLAQAQRERRRCFVKWPAGSSTAILELVAKFSENISDRDVDSHTNKIKSNEPNILAGPNPFWVRRANAFFLVLFF